MVLFWIRGKRAEDSEVVVVVVRSRRLKVKIKELFDLERNGVTFLDYLFCPPYADLFGLLVPFLNLDPFIRR